MPLVAHKNGESLWVSNQSQNRTKKLILWAVFVYKPCAGIFTYFHLGLWRLHPSTIKHKPGCLFFFFSFKPQHTFSWIRKQFPDTMKMDACLMMVTNVRCSAVPGHCDSNASSLPTLQHSGTSFLPVRRQVSWNEVRSNSANAYRKAGSSLCLMGWGAIMHSWYYCPSVHLGNRCCANDQAPSYSGRNHVAKINASWAAFSLYAFDEIHRFEYWNRLEAD